MSSDRSIDDRLLRWAEFAGFAFAAAALIAVEFTRHPVYVQNPGSLIGFVPDAEMTWVAAAAAVVRLTTGRLIDVSSDLWLWLTWVGLPLVAAPAVWWLGRRTRPQERDASVPRPRSSVLACIVASIFMFGLSVGMTAAVGTVFLGMPPAYHDEYSYIFQAKTFLAGRLYFPQHPLPDFFDQMHVLNDNGVFASRYFPGVGLWLAPWLAAGHPYWGQYLAGGLVVVLVFWIGRELGIVADLARDESTSAAERSVGLAIGVVAAVFCALSPAMLLFGNLLLSHHPTMLGLALFVLCYFRALRSESLFWPIVGGIALSFAMLCRPLTAFGFALPFGGHLMYLVLGGRLARSRARLTAALLPLVVGVALLAGYNAVLTGNPLRSPYGLYTRIYSPNHSYGFHNVTRGEKLTGPKVLENYNRWAEELTAPRAFELLGRRIAASSLWSIGPITLAWFAGVSLLLFARFPVQWRLLAAAVVGLHAVYFPFGFDGIFGLSYVFESVPILCALAAGVCVWLWRIWWTRGRVGRTVWIVLFIVAGYAMPVYRMFDPGPDGSLAQIRFARGFYANWDAGIGNVAVESPALIFIKPDPTVLHLDLVANSPDLQDSILRVRDLGMDRNVELARYFPDRHVWFYDATTQRMHYRGLGRDLRENLP
jgi:hypothetical protein